MVSKEEAIKFYLLYCIGTMLVTFLAVTNIYLSGPEPVTVYTNFYGEHLVELIMIITSLPGALYLVYTSFSNVIKNKEVIPIQ